MRARISFLMLAAAGCAPAWVKGDLPAGYVQLREKGGYLRRAVSADGVERRLEAGVFLTVGGVLDEGRSALPERGARLRPRQADGRRGHARGGVEGL